MKKIITGITAFVLDTLKSYKFILPFQALTLATLSLAYPQALQLNDNIALAALATALFLAFDLMAAAAIALYAYDFTKEGQYTLSFATVTFRERLCILAGTLALAALGLQGLALILPAIIWVSNFVAAFAAVAACQLVSHGVSMTQDLLTETQSWAGPTRQGKKRPKSRRRQ